MKYINCYTNFCFIHFILFLFILNVLDSFVFIVGCCIIENWFEYSSCTNFISVSIWKMLFILVVLFRNYNSWISFILFYCFCSSIPRSPSSFSFPIASSVLVIGHALFGPASKLKPRVTNGVLSRVITVSYYII